MKDCAVSCQGFRLLGSDLVKIYNVGRISVELRTELARLGVLSVVSSYDFGGVFGISLFPHLLRIWLTVLNGMKIFILCWSELAKQIKFSDIQVRILKYIVYSRFGLRISCPGRWTTDTLISNLFSRPPLFVSSILSRSSWYKFYWW